MHKKTHCDIKITAFNEDKIVIRHHRQKKSIFLLYSNELPKRLQRLSTLDIGKYHYFTTNQLFILFEQYTYIYLHKINYPPMGFEPTSQAR